MEFKLGKLPKNKLAELISFSIEEAEPFRLLPAPVYVLLPMNGKLISLKGPFDFFTPDDLSKFRDSGKYYYGPVHSRVEPFIEVARETKKILGWRSASATQALEPAPFEVSDAVLRKLATLWGPLGAPKGDSFPEKIGIENYFAAVFTNEICEPIPGEDLERACERDPDLYETALLRGGVFVFLALHLGYLDLAFLSALRRRFFREFFGSPGEEENAPISNELVELRRWTDTLIFSSEIRLISSEQFQFSISRVTQKLWARLVRIREQLIEPDAVLASVHEKEGGGRIAG